MIYTVCCEEKDIGTATLDRQGLFYCICCENKSADKTPYRILLTTQRETLDLGVCPPLGKIVSRFPVRRVGEEELRFSAVAIGVELQPFLVKEDADFPYLKILPHAYLRQDDGLYYIQFKHPMKDLRDSDLSR